MVKVIIAKSAIDELERIAEYIALVNENAAADLVAKVISAIERLPHHPKMGPFPHEFETKTYRNLLENPVRIFYRQEGNIIYVVHIFRMEMNITLDMVDSSSN